MAILDLVLSPLVLGIVAAYLAALAVTIHSYVSAPAGYEDSQGFHRLSRRDDDDSA